MKNSPSTSTSNTTKKYTCSECPYVTDSKGQFHYHSQFHLNREGIYKCGECSYNVRPFHIVKFMQFKFGILIIYVIFSRCRINIFSTNTFESTDPRMTNQILFPLAICLIKSSSVNYAQPDSLELLTSKSIPCSTCVTPSFNVQSAHIL